MLTVIYAVFSSHITVLMSTIQQAKLSLPAPPVKHTVFDILKGDQVLYMADYT